MRNILLSALIILGVTALVFGCKNNKENKKGESFVPLKMVEVPAMITDPANRVKFIVEHFWDGMNFRDTNYLSNLQNLNVHFSAYLDYLTQSTNERAKASVANLTDRALNGDPKIVRKFREMFEAAFYHPNSVYRNEELYIIVLEKFTTSNKISEAEKVPLKYQLDLAYRNRTGTKAIDFNYVLEDGRVKSLYEINSEFTLLIFIDPDCPTCQSVMELMKSSPVLSELNRRVKVLTIYAGVDFERWMMEVPHMNRRWINGCDKEMKIQNESLYDLRPTPALYLLDKHKVVILKDAPFNYIEEYLKKV
ncbi:MAG: DUF5106 domain-containing protein [Bacteroidales bacterium]